MDGPCPDEEAFPEAARAPTEADLGPQSLVSCSSSLVPYATEEDIDPGETQGQPEGTLKQMETDEQDSTQKLNIVSQPLLGI